MCPYCGVGCGLVAWQEGDRVKIKGDRTHPANFGLLCAKGTTLPDSLEEGRLLYPMMREHLDAPFERTTWDQALSRITRHIQETLATRGPEALCLYGSGQFYTEDYYVASKLFKGSLGTNNFDSNSRLCMSSAVSGYQRSLGSDGPPCSYEDLTLAETFLLIGSNTAECHPIIFNRILAHQRRHPDRVRLITADPRRTRTAQQSDLWLGIHPGTDVALLNGMARICLEQGWVDQEFVRQHTEGFDELCCVLEAYSPERVAGICGIEVEQLAQATEWFARSTGSLSLWSMGLNQSTQGVAKVQSLINLHLLTGQISRPGAGPFSLTGQPNAMGGREVGGLANLLPGYRSVLSGEDRQFMEAFWKLSPGAIATRRGLSASEIIEGMESGDIQLLWIAATNPAVSMPDMERNRRALRQSTLTVVQDAYFPLETADYAHILLPAAQWGEKTGCMTNSERRVSLSEQVRHPPGEAREDWAIFAEVGRRLGFDDAFNFSNSAEVFAEFVQTTRDRVCDMHTLSHTRLKMEGPQQWPCTHPDQPGQPRLYTDRVFPTPNGRAQFEGWEWAPPAEQPDAEFPLTLTTGRLYGHWHTLTRTGKVAKLRQMHPGPFLEMHPEDAFQLDIEDGETIHVYSRRGEARIPAKLTANIRTGTVFMPFHWGSLWGKGLSANALTHGETDAISLQPELKACAVRVEKII